jgi:hypothetical protein
MGDWITYGTGAVAVASAVTALFPTPPRPSPDAAWRVKLWWLIYQVVEIMAMVTQRVKERPNAAARIIAAAEARDISAVVAAAKGLATSQTSQK